MKVIFWTEIIVNILQYYCWFEIISNLIKKRSLGETWKDLADPKHLNSSF